ncbi:MAG: RNA polymerase sigma factor [Acidimicrobiia bacterium]
MSVSDDISFVQIAREQLPWLYSLARRIAAHQAEDVVQDCLMKAYLSFDSLRDPVAAPAWFRQILINCARDLHRKGLRRVDESPIDEIPDYTLYRRIADEDPLPYSDSVHLDFLHSFSEEDVWNVLDRLEPKQRIPLVLVHMEGLSVKEVSRMLGVPLNTVLSWLHRGRKRFEMEMWDYADEKDLLRQRQPEGARR